MSRFAPLHRAAKCTVAAILFLFGASPALAQNTAEIERLDQKAVAEFNNGLDARDAGRNGAACQHFRNAEVLYNNSIIALMGLPMRTEEQRSAITDFADQQQSSLNEAKARAKEICGRPDTPALTSSSSGSNSDATDWNENKKLELQRTRKLAVSQYTESNRLWDAGDRAGACAAIRLSAANFAEVTAAMKANPALESAFAPVAQHYSDEAYVIELRDGTFCKG